MIRILLAALYYIIAAPVIIIVQKLFQTGPSGPGLNIYAFIVVVIGSIWLMFRDLRKAVLNDNDSYVPVFIHLAGFALIIYLIFFDQVFMLHR